MARFAGLLIFVLLAPVAARAEPADCEGRNPLYCGQEAKEKAGAHVESDPDVQIVPPGGCEGRNPRYCRETEPEKKKAKAEPPRRTLRSPDNASRNPNRNPRTNPSPNPNRNPRGRGGE